MGELSVKEYILGDLDYIEISESDKDTLLNFIDYLYLNVIPFEEFECYFPEESQDLERLAHFILDDRNHKAIFKMVNNMVRIESNYRRRPNSHLLSDEFDKDDYEDFQNILKAGFRM